MCVRREHFEKTLFRGVHEGETKPARFVFAMRRPYVVGFLGAVAKAGASSKWCIIFFVRPICASGWTFVRHQDL